SGITPIFGRFQSPTWAGSCQQLPLKYPPSQAESDTSSDQPSRFCTPLPTRQSNPMSDRNYSPYQQKVIQRYYDNREQMDEQRLAELVTNLYLAPPKKQAKLWESAEELMTRMLIPATRIAHVMKTKDAAVLAKVVEEIQKGVLKRDPPPKKTT
ncbi:MAG: hypothetical protein ACK5YO_29030, partial [Planctomyces sp.]